MATTQQDVIKKFMASLDKTSKTGTAALNEAIQVCTNSKFKSIQAVMNKMITDCKAVGNANLFLKNYCGIILDNEDTGAITGSDMGGKVTKNADDIVPESGGLDTNFTGTSFNVGGLGISLRKFNDDYDPYSYDENRESTLKFSELTTAQKYIWQGLKSWWTSSGLDLITQSFGENFGFGEESSAKIKGMHFGFYDADYEDDDYKKGAYFFWAWKNNPTKISDIDLRVNMNYYKNIDTSDPNGYAPEVRYMDRVATWGLTQAAISSNMATFHYLPLFVKYGIGELVTGADDVLHDDIKRLAGNYKRLEKSLNLGIISESYPYPTNTDGHAGGYIFMRYLAHQFADELKPSNLILGTEDNDTLKNTVKDKAINALGGNDSVSNSATNVEIYGSGGNDTIRNTAAYVTIDGGADDDFISTYYKANVSAVGGTGNDTIYNYGGSDITISGGKGDDKISVGSAARNNVIQYAEGDGNDIVYGYANTDSIDIVSGDYTKTTVGNNVIINVGSGNITLVGAKKKTINIYSSANIFTEGDDVYSNSTTHTVLSALGGNDSVSNSAVSVEIYGGAGKDTLINTANYVTLDGGEDNDYLFGGTGWDVLIGGEGNDYIEGGAGKDSLIGGAGVDTLICGEGDDTLTGGEGNDLFVYASGDGRDIITDYTAETDKIKITSGSISKISYSGKNVIFNIGSGTLTVQNGKGKKITVIDSKGSTSTKRYSGSSALYLMTEAQDSFVLSDELSEITKNNLTPTSAEKIEISNFENLAQENEYNLTYNK